MGLISEIEYMEIYKREMVTNILGHMLMNQIEKHCLENIVFNSFISLKIVFKMMCLTKKFYF